VTPKSTISKGFRSYLGRLQDRNRLDRIVIDECHTILDSQVDFRPKMQELFRLMTISVPMVMLTATLPTVDKARLLQTLQLTPNVMQRFHSPHTTRTNITYRVEPVEDDEAAWVAFIRQQEARWHLHREKVIVYRELTGNMDTLVAILGVLAYHGQMAEAAKRRALQAFSKAAGGVTVVTTNALGVGINIPAVQCMIHVDISSMLQDYS
jgi:superfamily II DNA helicase RecQ